MSDELESGKPLNPAEEPKEGAPPAAPEPAAEEKAEAPPPPDAAAQPEATAAVPRLACPAVATVGEPTVALFAGEGHAGAVREPPLLAAAGQEAEQAPQEQAEGIAEEQPPPVGEAPAEGKPQEPAPAEAKPPQCYDGLETGLAWFGAEPFEPPIPFGYRPEAAEVEAGPPESAEALEMRLQRVRDRIGTRRKETEAQKRWHQRIPLAALSMVPISIVLIVFVVLKFLAGSLPDPREPLDEKLLEAQPVAEQGNALRRLGVVEASPQGWKVLPGDVVLIDSSDQEVALRFALAGQTTEGPGPEAGAKPSPKLAELLSRGLEVSCQVCVLQREADWQVKLELDESTFLRMGLIVAKDGSRSYDFVGGRVQKEKVQKESETALAGFEAPVKLKYWYDFKLILKDGSVGYICNGKTLAATKLPRSLSTVGLVTSRTKLALRNWRIRPLD